MDLWCTWPSKYDFHRWEQGTSGRKMKCFILCGSVIVDCISKDFVGLWSSFVFIQRFASWLKAYLTGCRVKEGDHDTEEIGKWSLKWSTYPELVYILLLSRGERFHRNLVRFSIKRSEAKKNMSYRICQFQITGTVWGLGRFSTFHGHSPRTPGLYCPNTQSLCRYRFFLIVPSECPWRLYGSVLLFDMKLCFADGAERKGKLKIESSVIYHKMVSF